MRAVLPVTATDVLAHALRQVHFTLVARTSHASQWKPRAGGSNAWAAGPRRTASCRAMLLANPHQGWGRASTFFEAQLSAPGYDCYGATLVGIPVLAIAFNDALGWTVTNNAHDGADDYELTLADGGYLYDGLLKPARNNAG